MSKMDELRALREARYAARNAGPSTPRTATTARTATRPAKAAPPVAPPLDGEAAAEALCGHKSMNGRTCTRERGHAATSHRYS